MIDTRTDSGKGSRPMLDLIRGGEPERLAAVQRYDVLDTPPHGTLTASPPPCLSGAAAEGAGGAVSIVDTDRIWFRPHHGLEGKAFGMDRMVDLVAGRRVQGPEAVADELLVAVRRLSGARLVNDLTLVVTSFGLDRRFLQSRRVVCQDHGRSRADPLAWGQVPPQQPIAPRR